LTAFEAVHEFVVDKIVVRRVRLDVVRHERAQRHNSFARRADGVERAGCELAAHPAPFERRVDLGVDEEDATRPPGIAGESGQLAVVVINLETVLVWDVSYFGHPMILSFRRGSPNPMLVHMDTPATVTAAVQLLQSKGYQSEFLLGEHGFGCRSCDHVHAPDQLVLDDTYRFEGDSDPGDESIVLGVRCPVCGAKGIVVSAYGPEAEPQLIALMKLLGRRGA
jgi:hypothetical protein